MEHLSAIMNRVQPFTGCVFGIEALRKLPVPWVIITIRDNDNPRGLVMKAQLLNTPAGIIIIVVDLEEEGDVVVANHVSQIFHKVLFFFDWQGLVWQKMFFQPID